MMRPPEFCCQTVVWKNALFSRTLLIVLAWVFVRVGAERQPYSQAVRRLLRLPYRSMLGAGVRRMACRASTAGLLLLHQRTRRPRSSAGKECASMYGPAVRRKAEG